MKSNGAFIIKAKTHELSGSAGKRNKKKRKGKRIEQKEKKTKGKKEKKRKIRSNGMRGRDDWMCFNYSKIYHIL